MDKKGFSRKEIASKLKIHIDTVHGYFSRNNSQKSKDGKNMSMYRSANNKSKRKRKDLDHIPLNYHLKPKLLEVQLPTTSRLVLKDGVYVKEPLTV